jgi:hypothetical protein
MKVISGLLMAGFIVVALCVVLVFDPFKWGLVYSDRFTWHEFEEINKGDSIESVISRFGEPVRPAESYVVLTQEPKDPCVAGGCQKYVFAGAVWGATFKEAIVITDAKGFVVHAVARQE